MYLGGQLQHIPDSFIAWADAKWSNNRKHNHQSIENESRIIEEDDGPTLMMRHERHPRGTAEDKARCWATILLRDSLLKLLKHVAVLCQILTELTGRCSRLGLARRIFLHGHCTYAPCEYCKGLYDAGLTRILLLGMGMVEKEQMLLFCYTYGDSSHLCGRGKDCHNPDDLVYESINDNNRRKSHHQVWTEWKRITNEIPDMSNICRTC